MLNWQAKYNLKQPDRGPTVLDQSDGIEWRTVKPDYTLANLAYLKVWST